MAGTRGFVTYIDDESNNISIRMSSGNATANGATLAKNPASGPWPYLAKDLRHILGVTTLGKRGRLVVLDETSDLWQVAAQTWTNSDTGLVYTKTSQIGEKKPANHIK